MNLKDEISSWPSDKIQASHLDRLAAVYVRQSTLQQVSEHQESTRLQYGLANRAKALGWQPERVLIIDDDLGKSGSSVEGRVGFQRLVSEVGLNHVGLILGIEMSRLARSSKDWHQLLEICALFGTLIADLDGIYDPSHYNDRLLLGLKGSFSEIELHVLKQRMLQGRLNKAQRGELGFHLPIGYVRRPSGDICFDPDEQAQQVIRLIFRKFEELGTVHAVLRYLALHQIQLGVRALHGANKGELEWRRPSRSTLLSLLNHPAYTGAYTYGRKQIDPRKHKAGRPHTGLVVKPPEEWLVLIKNHHPAYISWEQYQQNRAQLKANQNRANERGNARQGRALLSGLVVCQRCGNRMSVQYHRRGAPRYVCRREAAEHGGPLCQCLSGDCLDEYVTEQVLAALKPAAIELSLSVAMQVEQNRYELDQLWKQRLERAKFEAERAGRHYRFIEPENRLVARQLAQDWEAKLSAQKQLQEEYQRFCCQQPRQLSETEKHSIRQLANSLPALWNAETTTHAQRKEIIRQVIQAIRVKVEGESELVHVNIDWAGGFSSHARIIRPVGKWSQLSNYPQLCECLTQCAQSNMTANEIITRLHQQGFYPPKRQKTFTQEMVRALMRQLGLGKQSPPKPHILLADNEWRLPDLARELDMPAATLHSWVQRGWVKKARQLTQPPKYWIIWADDNELERLRKQRQRSAPDILHQRWKGEDPTVAPDSEMTKTSP
ncbi:site-specific recombinase, DNA invertase Pin [Leptolyngbya sp. PCC 7375]|nr:site-specific recombinase, DNA invertase Pin [Leptolyngbya sp. PCC 7375]EKV00530.1 site-specific recombinase, DNA invertase Pin [Leptolyngbya sp. PCC 7375]